MAGRGEGSREGSLEAPTRHPLDWTSAAFFDEAALEKELERVYDICHGCRRCVSLCNAFPTLFDLVDESPTLEVDGIEKSDFGKVVEHCYLCDLCYLTKCPYVPPHEWNVDFPHLMLRAKAVEFRKGGTRLRDKMLTSTDLVGRLAGIPVVAQTVNAVNKMAPARKALQSVAGIHADAVLPEFHSSSARKRLASRERPAFSAQPAGGTTGKVAVFTTCYGNRNAPGMVEAMVKVFEHNAIQVDLTPRERCCGMPKLELGDLESVAQYKEFNLPPLLEMIDRGYDIVAPIPSCVLMFKQELPLMFPDDEGVARVKSRIFDPFEYLMLRHREGRFRTDFKHSLGKIAWHVPCHQRVQNIGPKTREILELVPGTEVQSIERCSGHDGTYAVKAEYHEISMKICRPVTRRVQEMGADHYISDCPMAADQIQNGLPERPASENAFSLLQQAYGL